MNFVSPLDRSLFLFINGLNVPATDAFWLFATSNWFWIFFFVPTVYFLFKKFGRFGLVVAVCIPVLFLLADQGTNLAKFYFMRPRPCRAEDLTGLVYFIAPRCSPYGFWSAHAANAFAQIAFFICLFNSIRDKTATRFRRILFPYFILFGFLVSVSRIMVGVHYPGDILVGALYGVICGLLVYVLYRYFTRMFSLTI